jgi:hypothetical protein
MVPLGRGKGLGEMAQDALNKGSLKRARACGKSSHRLWAVDDDPADLDLAEQRKPINVGEAEGAPDLDLLTKAELHQRGADVPNLLFDARDQLGLVAAVDAEDRPSLGEESAFPVGSDLPALALGVDDRNASRSDGDVIDVCLAVPGDAAVVLARNAPRPPSFSRARCSRASWRRWCVRNALAPALPGSIGAVGPAATSGPLQPMHVTVRAAGSQIAVVPTGSSVKQTRH